MSSCPWSQIWRTLVEPVVRLGVRAYLSIGLKRGHHSPERHSRIQPSRIALYIFCRSQLSPKPRVRISVNLTAQINMAGTRTHCRLVLAILPLLFVGALCTNFGNDTDIKIGTAASSSFNVLPVTHTEFDPMVKKVDDLYAMVLNLFQDMARMQVVINNNNNLNNGANNQNNNNNNNNLNTRNTANNNNNGAAGR
ncbi:g4123 [Coccomyxa elongata]